MEEMGIGKDTWCWPGERATESLGPLLPDRGEERTLRRDRGSEREQEDLKEGQEG